MGRAIAGEAIGNRLALFVRFVAEFRALRPGRRVRTEVVRRDALTVGPADGVLLAGLDSLVAAAAVQLGAGGDHDCTPVIGR